MSYTNGLDKPSDYFNTKLYTGNNNTNAQTVGFQPDWVWLKVRSAGSGQDHTLYDSVRGATKFIESNTSNAEATGSNYLTSFDSNGFTLGNDQSHVNASGDSYASWNWKAGTSFTNDASGTGIGSIDSAGSVNTTSGFSIVSFTDGGSNATIAHGLGVVPKVIIIKNRAAAEGWYSYWQPLGNDKQLRLNSTAASADAGSMWNDTTPTSSVFSLDTNTAGLSSGNYIAYCFAEKQGYSKFGSYTGNGSTDGVFCFTGMKVGWLMIKRTDSANSWIIMDNKRTTFNPMGEELKAEVSDVGNVATRWDHLSNGFKLRNGSSAVNASGGTYIFMAFASNPFVTSSGVPATAR